MQSKEEQLDWSVNTNSKVNDSPLTFKDNSYVKLTRFLFRTTTTSAYNKYIIIKRRSSFVSFFKGKEHW